MPKKKQSPTLSYTQVLDHVATFIRTLHPVSELPDAMPVMFFENHEDGGLSLDESEARDFRLCLGALTCLPNMAQLLSAKSLERLLQQAVMSSLDPANRRPETTFEDRLAEALETLKTQLQTPPMPFEVFCPVGGLSSDGLPQQIGAVHFCVFDEAQRARFDEVAKGTRGQALIETWLGPDRIGQPYGIVHVAASDAATAQARARHAVRLTVDIINFYSDMLPFFHGHVYLLEEPARVVVLFPILVHDENPQVNLRWSAMKPLRDLSFVKLRELDATHHLGVERMSAILAKDNHTPLEERLLKAMQWAGRATVDSRNEEAFLLYAIALESLILMENMRDELLYRLSLRVAHLLGSDVASRQEIAKDVKRLYGIRSKIVHSGTYEVLDTDLSRLRWMTKNCIVALVNHQPFRDMTSPDDLREWFDARILSSTA